MIIWIAGLSGSGKTTIGHRVIETLRDTHSNLVHLDGDSFRDIFGNDVDYSLEGRFRNTGRICNFCSLLDKQGIHVVVTAMLLFPEWQAWNRKNLRHYREIYLDIPFSIVSARDVKGIYRQVTQSDYTGVVGVDIPFQPPTSPDITLTMEDENRGVDWCRDRILDDKDIATAFGLRAD